MTADQIAALAFIAGIESGLRFRRHGVSAYVEGAKRNIREVGDVPSIALNVSHAVQELLDAEPGAWSDAALSDHVKNVVHRELGKTDLATVHSACRLLAEYLGETFESHVRAVLDARGR